MTKLKRLGPLALSFFLLIAGLELVSFIYLSLSSRELHSPAFYYGLMNPPAQKPGCSWGDSVSHHPYLALRYHRRLPCRHPLANQRGMLGQEIPATKNPGEYNILLLGGSVAELMFVSKEFEKQLHQTLRPPQGKTFKILNGAITAGQQPRQAIAHLLLGETADIVITLEGFNEHFSYRSSLPLEAPPQSWYEMEDILQEAHGPHQLEMFLRGWLKGSAIKAAQNPILAHSYTAVLFYTVTKHALAFKTHFNDGVAPYLKQSKEEAKKAHIKTYAGYLASMGQLAKGRAQQLLVFFQPVPALYKPLTDADRNAAQDLSYAQDYQDLVTGVANHSDHKVKVIPILDTFKDYQGDLYIDLIHFRDDSRGNEWLARRIVAEMAKNTDLKKK